MVALIDLSVIDPVAPIFQFPVVDKLAVAVAVIVLKVASVDHAILIINLAKTTLLIIMILSSIFYSRFAFLEETFTMSQTVAKITTIIVSVAPVIFTFTVWPVSLVIPHIGLPVAEPLGAHPMLHCTFELAFVSAPAFHHEHPEPFNLVLLPLPNVTL